MTKLDPRAFPDLIRRPLITEKATRLLEENKYSFEVVSKATKPQIKDAIQELFDVKVVAVNTYNPPAKERRVGKFAGHRPQYKRAVVTLAEGDSITLFPEV
jgi:large subunit ribosomal protein L23